jgi:excisionase family DNA binding protein
LPKNGEYRDRSILCPSPSLAEDYACLTTLIKVRTLAIDVPRKSAKQPDSITIKEAASLLGVSEPTLRRWDEAGKFRARRHPINGYRLYDRAKVRAMRKRILGRAA